MTVRSPCRSGLARKAAVTAVCFGAGLVGAGLVGTGRQARSASRDAPETLLIPDPSWTCGLPDGIPAPEPGTPVLTAQLTLADTYDVGRTPYGRRRVCVVQGGTASGDRVRGTALAGGLDFALTLPNGVVEIEQLLLFRLDDDSYVYARNAGTGTDATDVRVVFDFEAPNGSVYARLNRGTFVGRRVVDPASKTMTLSVYDVTGRRPGGPAVKIVKPAGTPPQPWDGRKAATSETRGSPVATEFVTLSPGLTVGPSKRGIRNVIPITGGNLSGAITGKVLPGGADYQLVTSGPTLDARYLWQTADGDIVMVRNTGGFRSLVPTFETRVDGRYAWLNGRTCLSSSPQVSAGGVRITMYESR